LSTLPIFTFLDCYSRATFVVLFCTQLCYRNRYCDY